MANIENIFDLQALEVHDRHIVALVREEMGADGLRTYREMREKFGVSFIEAAKEGALPEFINGRGKNARRMYRASDMWRYLELSANQSKNLDAQLAR